jgi:hypothetical protein
MKLQPWSLDETSAARSATMLQIALHFYCSPARLLRKALIQPRRQAAKVTIPALLLSDIHFEPFWDPAKAPQLAAAPASEWKAILAAAPSPDQQQRFAALQQSCHARGADTSFALFDSSLKAMRATPLAQGLSL